MPINKKKIMTGKDFLTLLLVNYGFKEIEIKTYKGEFGAQGYDIDAYNKEYDEHYHEVNCEGLMYNITHIIYKMQDSGIKFITLTVCKYPVSP